MTEHTITGCRECCFCDGMDASCCYPDSPIFDSGLDEYDEPHPDCPMREEAGVFRIKDTPTEVSP